MTNTQQCLELNVITTRLGLRVDLPATDDHFVLYSAARISGDPRGTLRLARLDVTADGYILDYGFYRKHVDQLGKIGDVHYWERLAGYRSPAGRSRTLHMRYDSNTLEYQAFKLLDDAERSAND